VLGDKVKEVRVTHRLTASPACLVTDPSAMSTNLERLLKAAGHKVPETKPTLEVNPQHPLVRALKHESDEKLFADWSHILFDQAVLAEGGQLDDPGAFVKRINELMLALIGGAGPKIWTPGN
jgi:molecular chaperone HtpG